MNKLMTLKEQSKLIAGNDYGDSRKGLNSL